MKFTVSVADWPLQMVVVPLITEVGRALTVIVVEPVRSDPIALQLPSASEVTVYVVVAVGDTVFDQFPLPVPVTVPPLLLSTSVHDPLAVTVPVIVALEPTQIDVLLLVMFAVGLGLTVITALPVMSPL